MCAGSHSLGTGTGPTEAEVTELAWKMTSDLNLCSELEINDGGWASYLLHLSLSLSGFGTVYHSQVPMHGCARVCTHTHIHSQLPTRSLQNKAFTSTVPYVLPTYPI